MSTVFQAKNGKVAIWTGSQDDAPFTSPLSNLSRVKFHSDFQYPKIIDVKNFTLNLPELPTSGSGAGSGGANGVRARSYVLGSHGRPGQPFVIGRIVVNGVAVAFTGSVPIEGPSDPPVSGSYRSNFAQWLALGVDATNIIVHEYAVQGGDAGTQQWERRAAKSMPITVYITDILL